MYHSRWKNSHKEAGFAYGDRLYKNNIIINFKDYTRMELKLILKNILQKKNYLILKK